MTLRITRRGLRLGSGIVLFAYVTAHFTNHALGLISLEAAEQGLQVAVAVWQSLPGTVLLYGAAAVHVTLAFLAIYRHRTLRLPWLEWVRIAAGLSMPTLLIGHAVDTRLAYSVYGHATDYAHIVWSLWHSGREGRQLALLVPGWLHGCLGLGFVFAAQAWYPRWRLPLFGAAILLPVLAVLGFFSMLKEVAVRALDPAWAALVVQPVPTADTQALGHLRDGMLALYYGAIVTVFLARVVRSGVESRRASVVSVAYPGRTVRVPRGWSVLEASRAYRIPHVSVCGGRARCSTCRVRILAGRSHCPAPDEDERHTLARVGAADDVRLACQLRPRGDVRVVPLVSPVAVPLRTATRLAAACDVTVMLVDLRWQHAGTRLLPHDLLHALDRFGAVVAEVASQHGGTVVAPPAGDRWTLVFGIDLAPADSMRQATQAAEQLDARLRRMHLDLQREFGSDLRHLIHLHFGAVFVGQVGEHAQRAFTATGPAVDMARQMAAATLAGSTSDAGVVASQVVFDGSRPVSAARHWFRVAMPGGESLAFARLEAPEGVTRDREAGPEA